MSFPKYPEYKDSGIEWLGEVPVHWEVTKLSYITNRIGSGKTPSGGATAYVSSGVPFIRSQNVHDQGLRLDDIVYIDEATDREMAWSRVKPLDVLINITGASIGRSCQVPADFGRANVNQHVCVIRLDKAEEASDWVSWTMKAPSTKEQVKVSQTGAAREGLNFEQLAGFYLCMPSFSERKAISSFLDYETARIDALVGEQQRLIELLKEKRQAVISHAVTKGLDPDVPMKDSGVEWLGEVPAHWDVVPTGYRYEIQLGRMLNEARSSGDNLKPYLRVFDVQWGVINTQDLPLMDFPPGVQKVYRLEPGDLMVNEGGSYVGRSAIWRGELRECYYQKALHRLRHRCKDSDTADFFLYVMEMTTQKGAFVANANQTTIDHLTAEQLRSHRFAFPPLDEQETIAQYLEDATVKLEKLTEEAKDLITLLQERRSALICAAVTGKIDVRGWQADQQSEQPEVLMAAEARATYG